MKFSFSFLTLMLCGAVSYGETDEFNGMNALCIGCSSGIGRAAAEILLRGGAKVVVSSRTQSKCDDVVGEFERGFAVAGDVGRAEDLKHVAETSRRLLGGPVSHLIYVPTSLAGPPISHNDTDALVASFDEQMAINVNGLARAWKLVEADLVAAKGAAVAVSSIRSFQSGIGMPAYYAAKAAQNSLVRQLALDVGRRGVRVNSVSPACIDTPIFDVAFGEATDDIKRELAWRHLLGRIGKPEEVGHTIAFLLSEKAGFITGQNIVVDGGMGLMNTLSDVYVPYLIPESDQPERMFFALGGYKRAEALEEQEL